MTKEEAISVNAAHAKAGTRGRWFPSMIDWLDTMPAGIIDQDGKQLDPIAVLADFLKLIHDTPNLDYLLLTKRPENFRPRMDAALEWIECDAESSFDRDDLETWVDSWLAGVSRFSASVPPNNVWIGVSVEDQQRADERIPELLKIPAKVRFISAEPLLSAIDFSKWIGSKVGLDLIICGGESGPGARPCNVGWIRSIVAQCKAAQLPVFVKQLGSRPVCDCSVAVESFSSNCVEHFPFALKDKKGGDMSEWSEDLRIRQFPTISPPRQIPAGAPRIDRVDKRV